MPAEEEKKVDAAQDAQPEEAAAAAPEAEKPAKADKKKNKQDEEIRELKEKLAEATDRHMRLMAEFDNYRKRTQREKEAVYPDAVANTVAAMLPVLDNFERALESPCTDQEFRKGVLMIYNGFHSMLDGLGVAEIGTVGEPFDPNIHNAVMHVDDDKLEKNVVAMVLQKGYRMGDRIIRCAMVQQAN